jgi:hypothetical protein
MDLAQRVAQTAQSVTTRLDSAAVVHAAIVAGVLAFVVRDCRGVAGIFVGYTDLALRAFGRWWLARHRAAVRARREAFERSIPARLAHLDAQVAAVTRQAA